MIQNYLCCTCDKSAVCKIMDILVKFTEDAKKPLGVNLTMNSCASYEYEEGSDEIYDEGTEE